MKVAILAALPDELDAAVLDENLEEHEVEFIFTGVGKIKAAKHAAKLLNTDFDLIINAGTAGSKNRSIGEICFVDEVHLHDYLIPIALQDLTGSYPDIKIQAPIGPKNVKVATGDRFVTDNNTDGDLFDMELYSIAHILEEVTTPFMSIKIVSDNINEESEGDWARLLPVLATSLSMSVCELINNYDKIRFYNQTKKEEPPRESEGKD
jgi:nucleoside phosphorylase